MNKNPLNYLYRFLKLLTTEKSASQQRSALGFTHNHVDQLIIKGCEQIELTCQSELKWKLLDGITATARFPEEEKTKLLTIMQSKPFGGKESKQIVEIIYKNYMEMSRKASLDYSDIINEHIHINLKDTENKYVFFYDETNNYRKFWLKNGQFNRQDHLNFVLGGIVYDEKYFNGNTDSLFVSLELQSDELKTKHLLKTQDFKKCLKEKKLTEFLKWIYEAEIYVHYWNVDSLYNVANQIIEMLVKEDYEHIQGERILYGDILYITIKKNTERVSQILHRYTYPNVKDEQIQAFWGEWLQLFNEQNKDIPTILVPIYHAVRERLVEAKNMKKRVESYNEDFIILANYSPYYILSFLLFPESFHVFDDESEIMKLLQRYPVELNNEEVRNYKFVNSITDRRIQISDVLVGCLGRFFTFLKTKEGDQLLAFVTSLGHTQRINLALLCKILRKSFDKNPAFTSSINSWTERNNLEYIMGIFSLEDSQQKYVFSSRDRKKFIIPTEQFTNPLKSLSKDHD